MSAQEGQGSPSAPWNSVSRGLEYAALVWMESALPPAVPGDMRLGARTDLRAPLSRSNAGSTKAELLGWGTALGGRTGLCTWLLGSGKCSILLTRMEWKEWLSPGHPLRELLSHPPAQLPHPPQRRRGSAPAHSCLSLDGCIG